MRKKMRVMGRSRAVPEHWRADVERNEDESEVILRKKHY